MIRRMRPFVFAAIAAAAVLMARPAFAGPPLLCFPFEIGAAKSLPMGHRNWRDTDPKYDASRLVGDTLALLTAETPVMVRMETLRRATIYAAGHPELAAALLTKLRDRANMPTVHAGLAVFDFGYLVESYRQAEPIFKHPLASLNDINGYQLVLKARALQSDPAMDYAAKLITDGQPKRAAK